jgi:hypothetical protein
MYQESVPVGNVTFRQYVPLYTVSLLQTGIHIDVGLAWKPSVPILLQVC